MYSVELTTLTGSPTISFRHGPLLPILVDPTMQVVELERLSSLQKNRVYAAEIVADGVEGLSETILLSKMDLLCLQ